MVPGKVTLDEKVVQVSAGDSHSAALTEDGSVYIWGSFRVSESIIASVYVVPETDLPHYLHVCFISSAFSNPFPSAPC